jgi:hypothetical protein
MQKIFLATIYLVSVISTVSAADILSCQSEMKYSQSAVYDFDNKPMKAGVCRDPYMTLCEGPYPDTSQHYDLPVSSMKATDLEYRAEFPAPDSGKDDGDNYTLPTQVLLSVNRTDGSFFIRWTIPSSKAHNPNYNRMRIEAIEGPVFMIKEYTGHCELKHVETKF